MTFPSTLKRSFSSGLSYCDMLKRFDKKSFSETEKRLWEKETKVDKKSFSETKKKLWEKETKVDEVLFGNRKEALGEGYKGLKKSPFRKPKSD